MGQTIEELNYKPSSQVIGIFYLGEKGVCVPETISKQHKAVYNFSRQHKTVCNLVQNCLARSLRQPSLFREGRVGRGVFRGGFCGTQSQALRSRVFQCRGNTRLAIFVFVSS